ncbi:unnamed protein product [Cochlearia groenlandica]
MLNTIFIVLLLPCIGMCIVFIIYLILLCYTTRRRINRLRYLEPVKPVTSKGLSTLELEKLPRVTGQELADVARSTECAVCLEEIESYESARLVVGCNHGFHQLCADTWLRNHTVCPVCRLELGLNVNTRFSENNNVSNQC